MLLFAGCLNGLFSQILQGDEVVRDRAIKFMQTRLLPSVKDMWDKEVEEMFIVESKKVTIKKCQHSYNKSIFLFNTFFAMHR